MSIFSNHRFSKFGFLDTEAVQDGEALDSFRLSVIARNHNTLRDERDCLLSVPFDAETDDSFVSNYGAYQTSFYRSGWVPMFWPMPFLKRPHVRQIEVTIFGMAENADHFIQAATYGKKFRPNAKSGDSDVMTILSGGTPNTSSVVIPVRQSELEVLQLFGRASRLQQLGDSGTYGRNTNAVGSGTDFFVGTNFLHWESGTTPPGDVWASLPTTAATYARGHYIVFYFGPSSGEMMTSPRRIWTVERAAAGFNRLRFDPMISAKEAQELNEGGKFEIHTISSMRLHSIAAYDEREIG